MGTAGLATAGRLFKGFQGPIHSFVPHIINIGLQPGFMDGFDDFIEYGLRVDETRELFVPGWGIVNERVPATANLIP